MLHIIRNLLAKVVDDIDTNNTNITYEDLCKLLRVLSNIDNGNVEMSKSQAADYLKVCRATFDNYVRDGYIPEGKVVPGFKEKRWYKSDLDLFLNSKL